MHIAGHVYLSNYFAAKSLAMVQGLGITHVLVCAAELPHELPMALARQLPTLVYTKLELADNTSSMLDLQAALAAIDAAAAAGGWILVHCAAGASRSASMVIAWAIRD